MYILIFLEFHSLEEIPWQRNNHVFIGIFPFTKLYIYNYNQHYHIVILFINLYAEYIMRNAGLDEAQAGVKIAKEKHQ